MHAQRHLDRLKPASLFGGWIRDGFFSNYPGAAGLHHLSVVAQKVRDLLDIGIEIGVGLADQGLHSGAVRIGRGLVDEHKAAVPVFHEDQTRIRVDDLSQHALMTVQGLPRASALECFEHRGPETDDAVFQDVVGGAVLEIGDRRLLIE